MVQDLQARRVKKVKQDLLDQRVQDKKVKKVRRVKQAVLDLLGQQDHQEQVQEEAITGMDPIFNSVGELLAVLAMTTNVTVLEQRFLALVSK